MRRLMVFTALTFCGCFAPPVELAAKSCDVEGRCVDGYTCVNGLCLAPDQFECLPGETRICGSDVGVCRKGLATCSLKGWFGDCVGEIAPSPERCDGLDNDCDGLIDEDHSELCPLQKGVCRGAQPTCVDGVLLECGVPEYGPDYEADETLCDGLDNDCDGEIDEGLDRDLDGYGLPGISCRFGTGDCDDDNPQINPGMEELCNGVDDNCDGRIDEGLDEDQDGHGREGASGCRNPGVDCDDTRAEVYPGAPELCDGLDNDCDGFIDEDLDEDQDGYGRKDATGCRNPGVDCDDTDPLIHPGATERCNGLDDDCDGVIDELLDVDQDGYGRNGVTGCRNPGTDCDDTDPLIHPGAAERCNGLDDDCDGKKDEDFDCVKGAALGSCAYQGAACATTGKKSCSSSCTVVCAAPTEICNGRDDDCDGQDDEPRGVSAPVTLSSPGAGARNPAIVGLSPRNPPIAGLSPGGFLITWQQTGALKVHLLRADGSRIGPETSVALGASLSTTGWPGISETMLGWREASTTPNGVRVAPLTLTAGGVEAGPSKAISGYLSYSQNPEPVVFGSLGDAPALAWTAGSYPQVHRLNPDGSPLGTYLRLDRGSRPVFAVDERPSPARAALAWRNLEAGELRTENLAGTGYDPIEPIGSKMTDLAATSGALAWFERLTTTDMTLKILRLNDSRTTAELAVVPGGEMLGIARLGDEPVWMLAWVQPTSREIASMRVEWDGKARKWIAGPVSIVATSPSGGPVSLVLASDGAVATVAYQEASNGDVLLRVLCP